MRWQRRSPNGALRPRVAVGVAALMNLIGAFLSIKVATTIATGIVDAKALTLTMVFAALIGAIAWNLVTWALSLPSSSSHALIGGVVGAAIAAIGTGAVKGDTLVEKVIVPAILSPVIAGLVAIAGTAFAYVMVARLREGDARRGYRVGQIGSASLVSLAHGTNDSQKTMGIITLALIAHGNLDADNFTVPLWVKIGCGVAIAAGTYVGGWRIINTMGNRLTEIEAPQGFAAESSRIGHPRLLVLRLPTLDHPRGLGRGRGLRHRPAPGLRAMGDRRTDGGRMAADHPRRGHHRRGGLRGGRSLRQGQRRAGDRRLIAAGLAAVLYVVTQRTPVRANDLDRSHADARSDSRTAVPVAA
jgi:Phosphate transporter family